MNRYLAVFRGSARGPGIIDTHFDRSEGFGRYHPRPDYGDVEIGATVRWLNEREKGYPTVYPLEESLTASSV